MAKPIPRRVEPEHPDWELIERLRPPGGNMPTRTFCARAGHRFLEWGDWTKPRTAGKKPTAYCKQCNREVVRESVERKRKAAGLPPMKVDPSKRAKPRKPEKWWSPEPEPQPEPSPPPNPFLNPAQPEEPKPRAAKKTSPARTRSREAVAAALERKKRKKAEKLERDAKAEETKQEPIRQLSDQSALVDLIVDAVQSSRKAAFLEEAIAARLELLQADQDRLTAELDTVGRTIESLRGIQRGGLAAIALAAQAE